MTDSVAEPDQSNMMISQKVMRWLSKNFDIQVAQTPRRSDFSGARPYMWYAECLKNCYNAVDRTFCEAIKHDT